MRNRGWQAASRRRGKGPFDRTTYQRDYMRKRRAAKTADAATPDPDKPTD